MFGFQFLPLTPTPKLLPRRGSPEGRLRNVLEENFLMRFLVRSHSEVLSEVLGENFLVRSHRKVLINIG